MSLANAVRVLGGILDVETAKTLAGTTCRNGTSRQGIIRGLTALGYRATPYHSRNPDNAWKWLKKHAARTPIIALADHQEHWVVFSGAINDKIILIDGSPVEGDNGVEAIGKQSVLDRLNHLGHYYCIRAEIG